MSKPVTIEDLEVNPNRKLTSDSKRALVKIIEDEFMAQNTLYNANSTIQREKILESYRKEVGFTAMKRELDKAEQAVEMANDKVFELKKKFYLKGLDEHGERYKGYNEKRPEVLASMRKIDELFKTVEGMAPSKVRNKVISRLWLSDTHGEAYVILNQVLGNGIIPQVTSNMLLEDNSNV